MSTEKNPQGPITNLPKPEVDASTAEKVKGGAEPVSKPKPAEPVSAPRKI